MARRSKQDDPEHLRQKLVKLFDSFSLDLKTGTLRSKVLSLVPAFHLLRDLGSSLIDQKIPAALERIVFYFRQYPNKIIKADELMVVSGISDWPRRVRQLRVEQGWTIISGVTAKEMAEAEEGDIEIDGKLLSSIKPDEYVLLNEQNDREAAHRWFQANNIRKLKGVSVQDKLLKFLKSNVGKPVTGEELRYVAGNSTEWARRVRELRTEEGWPVVTRSSSGWQDLAIGSYVLEEDRQAPAHDRKIPDEIRFKVLTRDIFKCQSCSWSHEQLNPADPRRLLELHHRVHHAKGGENTLENLITFCNVCHDEIHAKKLSVENYLFLKNSYK